jgi:hypothetical protein
MGAFFTALLAKFAAVLVWIGKLWVAIFVALWDLLRDVACWPFEQAMTLAKTAIESLPLDGISSNLGAWGSLPSEVINILGLLGVGTAVTIITAAIGIRLVLQLIPFVRLGS